MFFWKEAVKQSDTPVCAPFMRFKFLVTFAIEIYQQRVLSWSMLDIVVEMCLLSEIVECEEVNMGG